MAAPWQKFHQFLPFPGEMKFSTDLDITPCLAQATERMQTPSCPIAKASCHAVLKATARFLSSTSTATCRDVLNYQSHPGPLPLHLVDMWPKHLSHRNIKFPTKLTLLCLSTGRKLQAHFICVYMWVFVWFFLQEQWTLTARLRESQLLCPPARPVDPRPSHPGLMPYFWCSLQCQRDPPSPLHPPPWFKRGLDTPPPPSPHQSRAQLTVAWCRRHPPSSGV